MLKHKHPDFVSDVFTLMDTVGAQLLIGETAIFMSLFSYRWS